MDNSWVKLYRKINLNAIMRDGVALQLFIWILTNVDKDTGEVTFGRYLVARELRINPNTLYSALKRLVGKYKIIAVTSTTEYTSIRLLQWEKYQSKKQVSNTNDNNLSSTVQQSDTTLARIENKNIETSSVMYLQALPQEDVEQLHKTYDATRSQIQTKAIQLANYCEAHGKKYKNYRAMLLNALLRDFGYRKPVITASVMPVQTLEERTKALAKAAEIRKQLQTKFRLKSTGFS